MLKNLLRRARSQKPPSVPSRSAPSAKRQRWIEASFHLNPDAAVEAYFLYNGDSPEVRERCDEEMIRRAVAFDYVSWPRKIAAYVHGRDLLDVGCGTGLHAIGFVVVGVKSYTGLDPKVDLDNDRSKNKRTLEREGFGWTPRQMMQVLPQVELIAGSFEQVAPERSFDVAVLHNVTEHLIEIEEVFEGVWQRLRPGGRMIFNHHNFYCWNGHHGKPKYVREIDPTSPEQATRLDWAHLTPDPERDAYLASRVNRIRLDDLKALTERLFHLESWEENLSDRERGAGRLTAEIRARHPECSERELLTQGVLCRATKRDRRGPGPA